MHSDVYEPFCDKLCIVVDIDIYSLMLAKVPLTFSEVTGLREGKNFWVSYLTNLSTDLDGTGYAVGTVEVW